MCNVTLKQKRRKSKKHLADFRLLIVRQIADGEF